MKENLKEILHRFNEDVKLITDEYSFNLVKVKYMGKSGLVNEALKLIKQIERDKKREYGEAVNKLKISIDKKLNVIKNDLEKSELENMINNAKIIDLTTPLSENVGSLHPITITQKKLVDIFEGMGFYVEDGNEIESEFNNFEAVNVPKNHPARDMQDTFYLENNQVLKTHTSASQNRIMKKFGAPLKVVFPGRCFRNEELDASHENTFFQFEGMMIDENISIANLIYFMKSMLSKMFERDIEVRLRPGYFPFVEPGFELDCKCIYCEGEGCSVCKQTGWIELCPCGMIHKNVLEMGGIDSNKYKGFAFGLGLSRLAMMAFNISDIRTLNSGKITKLKQTKIN